MKRLTALFLLIILAAGLCPAQAENKYSRTVYGYFDTVITLTGYTSSQEVFDAACDEALEELKTLHRLFDGYNSYPSLHNLWYINAHAGKGPVKVDERLFDLLIKCRDMQAKPGHEKVNIAMGRVLALWHDAREEGTLPDTDALSAASLHTDFSKVILDEKEQTVFFADSKIKLDLGAVGKGYAADRVKKILYDKMPSFLINLGGNVYAADPPLDGRKKWGISVQCPDGVPPVQPGSDRLDVLYARNLSLVTSGDYQRFMEIDGIRYHHLIDPSTLWPASHLRAVTVACESGFEADFYSTLLFLLPLEEGIALVEELPHVEALFVSADGSLTYSRGLQELSQVHGASAR